MYSCWPTHTATWTQRINGLVLILNEIMVHINISSILLLLLLQLLLLLFFGFWFVSLQLSVVSGAPIFFVHQLRNICLCCLSEKTGCWSDLYIFQTLEVVFLTDNSLWFKAIVFSLSNENTLMKFYLNKTKRIFFVKNMFELFHFKENDLTIVSKQ